MLFLPRAIQEILDSYHIEKANASIGIVHVLIPLNWKIEVFKKSAVLSYLYLFDKIMQWFSTIFQNDFSKNKIFLSYL